MLRQSCAVLALCCAAAAQTQPAGSIAGVVRDPTGRPLGDIRLVLAGGPGGRQTKQSGADGEFSFPGLPAARYQLTAQSVADVLGTKSILLDAGQDFKLVLTLNPAGSISGRLLDEKGEAVTSGFNVALIAAVYEAGLRVFQPQSIVQIDKQGKYSLTGVKAGRSYRVLATNARALPPTVSTVAADVEARQPELAQAWFPAAASADEAEPLVLFPGERRENVDIRLPRRAPRCIEAQVDAPPGPGVLYVQTEDEQGIPLGTGNVPEDGRIRFCTPFRAGLRLTARKGSLSDRAVVAPGSRDVLNLHLRPQPPVTIPGVVELEGDAPAPAAGNKMSVGILRGGEPVDVTIPGSFSLTVKGDDAVLDYGLRQAPKGYYVKRASCGGVPIAARRLPPGCSSELRIAVARDGGTLSVQVQDADGKPVPDVWVVAAPSDVAGEGEMSTRMWGGPVDALGAFASAIAPGKYLVIATTTWLDLNTETVARFWRARSKATEVEVGPNGSVNLRLAVTNVEF